jgi:hypothetical protein
LLQVPSPSQLSRQMRSVRCCHNFVIRDFSIRSSTVLSDHVLLPLQPFPS